ncbi:CreA family protein [Aeromonas diversa CDC 2478-85]|uniref:CreA family protein n=1 Tax=Aeromonas diversa CDC 2478-85 TaxID=1268237 RepID=N9VL63_9GAMM|nr:CreA family protein [Aeromonas diversa CDC 2478-85]
MIRGFHEICPAAHPAPADGLRSGHGRRPDRRGEHRLQAAWPQPQDSDRGVRRSPHRRGHLLPGQTQDRRHQGRVGVGRRSLPCHPLLPSGGPHQGTGRTQGGEEVFDVSTSLVFKEQRVVRFYDKKRNALVYLTYSTRLVDGSYKSAMSAVPIMPWG